MKMAICDDESVAREILVSLTEDYMRERKVDLDYAVFASYVDMAERIGEFDLFVMDYQMPDVNGLEFAARIREQYGSESKAIIFVNCVPERVAGYDKIAERIGKYPEVESLSLISGKAEFILTVKGENMREISNFVAHKLAPTDGVNGTETMFILKEYKRNGINFDEKKEDGERLLMI